MFNNILVAVDGSAQAGKAVSAGSALAAKFDANLILLCVVDHSHAPRDVARFAEAEAVDDPEKFEERSTIETVLKPLEDEARRAGVNHIRAEVSRGDPAHSILGFADGGDVDLIVMGRRGLGPFEGLLMGSVSSKVTALAACPVLTVK